MTVQEFQGIQNRYQGRMEENERRVAQVIGSEARTAKCGQSSHKLHEHQVLLQAGEREKEHLKNQVHSELESHSVSYRRSWHEREVQQQRITQNLEYQEAQLRVQY